MDSVSSSPFSSMTALARLNTVREYRIDTPRVTLRLETTLRIVQ